MGQLLVGAGFARWILLRQRWRRPNRFVLLLISLWFVCSGLCELFVSGMEASHDLRGAPTMATFTLWRGRADMLLLWASLALFLLGLPVALWLRLRSAHKDSLQDASLPEGGVRAQARDGIGGNHS